MKKYNVNVNFISKRIYPENIDLVQNDYNSTIMNFLFDVEATSYLFKLMLPDGTEWIKDIKDNKLIIEKGVLAQKGTYKYEIAAYGESKRLTAIAIGKLTVRKELISTDEIVEIDDRIPVLDSLINQVDSINIDVEKTDNVATVTLISKEGTRKEVAIYDGTAGEKGRDALINGVNTLNIVEGTNVTLNQEGETLTINAEDIPLKETVNKINEDLGNDEAKIQELENDVDNLYDIKADRTEIPDVSEFVKKTTDDLVNYYKKDETYNQTEVNQLIGAIKTVSMKVLPSKPETGEANVIYLIPSPNQTIDNIYDEWIYVDNKWELIGTTQVDLTDYVKNTDYASSTKGGVVKFGNSYGTTILANGVLAGTTRTYEQYDEGSNYMLIGKGTLENVIEGKELTNKDYVDVEVEKLDNRIDEIELTKFPNAIIHGTPTINQGQISNFSQENYLSLPAIFDLHDRGFEFNFAFRTNDDVTTAQNIIGSKFCMALFIQNSKINLRVSQNGTNWDLVDIQGNIDIQPNTTYYIQIYFDKLTYKLKYSLDGQTFTDIASKVASVSPNPSQIYLGVGNNFFNPFKGIINLNKCYLKINNSIIWRGLDDAGLQTRLATDLENIDAGGIAYINGLIEEKGYITPEDTKDFIKATNYATETKGGTIRTSGYYDLSITANGSIYPLSRSYTYYRDTAPTTAFISKGTLENVITGKELVNKTYVDGLIGDINSQLATLTNLEGGE